MYAMSTATTTIRVSPAVREAIAHHGQAGQSLNSVLEKILALKQEPQKVKGKNEKNEKGIVFEADPNSSTTRESDQT